jgi:hypothetical protein
MSLPSVCGKLYSISLFNSFIGIFPLNECSPSIYSLNFYEEYSIKETKDKEIKLFLS